MIKENRVSKYLLYAIGEIILVVIGILLAVSINDWNSNRKSQQEIEHLLNAFQKDLTVNVKEGVMVLDWAIRRDSAIEQILQRQVTLDMYYKKQIMPMFLNYNSAAIITENLDRLLGKEDQLKIVSEPLLILLKKYNAQLEREAVQREEMSQYSLDQNKYLVDNMPWFNAYVDSTSIEAATYFMEDEIYLNKTRFYQNLINNNYGRSMSGRLNIELLMLYHLLKMKGEQSKLKEVFADLGFSPMTEVDCTTELELNGSKKHYVPLVINVGSDTLSGTMDYTNRGQHGTVNRILGPGEYEVGFGFIPFTLKVLEEDSCVAKYLPSAHSYLILGEK